jgi:alpha-tubulin suppressor-like RCC1 family protein
MAMRRKELEALAIAFAFATCSGSCEEFRDGGADAAVDAGTDAGNPDGGDADTDAGPGDYAVLVTAGGRHTCAIVDGGYVKCWGDQQYCQIGYGYYPDSPPYGFDSSLPSTLPFVDIGEEITQVSSGGMHTCTLTIDGGVKCWGWGVDNELGIDLHGSSTIGCTDVPADFPIIDFGVPVIQVEAGNNYTCVLLENGNVICFGTGLLGYGTGEGYHEYNPAGSDAIELGGPAKQISTGMDHICAVLENGDVLCWGAGGVGALGYGNTEDVGNDEVPADVGPIDLGGPAVQVSCGSYHTCTLLETGDVLCWGLGDYGMLGYGNTEMIGDDEVPADVGPVDVGGMVVQVAAGTRFTCVLLETGDVKCWGMGKPALGYGNSEDIGDDEVPADVGVVNVGGAVTQITTGMAHTCALLETGEILCWGDAGNGRLGYGDTGDIGDDETPADIGPVQLF